VVERMTSKKSVVGFSLAAPDLLEGSACLARAVPPVPSHVCTSVPWSLLTVLRPLFVCRFKAQNITNALSVT
jgi:hypothetical protein